MFHSLNWRPDRIDHIRRHGIGPEEVEEAVFQDTDCLLVKGPKSNRDPSRHLYYVYGRTGEGRFLFVVLLDEGDAQALPVTVRDMNIRERRRYRA